MILLMGYSQELRGIPGHFKEIDRMNNLTNTNNSPGFKGDKLDVIASIFEKQKWFNF